MTALSESYLRDGWVLVPQAVAPRHIDQLLAAYETDLKASRRRFFRQNTNRYEPNSVDRHGHVTNAFLDPHNFESLPPIREAIFALLFDGALQGALAEATGFERFHLMQSMLFDKNAETPAHQDWWYLDSVPEGHLAAAWIALEDIAEAAGRFYLMSGTHEVVLHQDLMRLRHSEWLSLLADYCRANPDRLEAPALKKGDVVIWNSRTIHGALPIRDSRYSRKSLTAHFLPAELGFGNLFVRKDWIQLKAQGDHYYFANQPEYSLLNDLKFRLKVAIRNNPTLMRGARWWQRRVSSRGRAAP